MRRNGASTAVIEASDVEATVTASRAGQQGPDETLEALWREFWADRSCRDIRTRLAQAYEFVIPCVIRSLGRPFKAHWERGELYALGYIGLLQSVDSFAPGSNHGQFAAYATPRVRGVIMDELRSLDFFPRGVRENVNRIREATERLTTERGEVPNRAAVAAAAGLTTEQGERVQAAMNSIYFLRIDQQVAQQGTEAPMSEMIPSPEAGPEATVLDAANRDDLIAALVDLPPRERATLSYRYFGRLTQIQIAGMIGVSHSRVCQIEKSAVEHLRARLTANDRRAIA